MLAFLQRLARGSGLLILIAIHDLDQVLRFADMTMVLSDGGLWASGPTEEVITVEMLERVYRVHARVEPCSRGFPHISVDGAA